MDYEEFVRVFRARAAARMAEFDAQVAQADKQLAATRAAIDKTKAKKNASHPATPEADVHTGGANQNPNSNSEHEGIEPQRLRHSPPQGRSRVRKVKRIMN